MTQHLPNPIPSLPDEYTGDNFANDWDQFIAAHKSGQLGETRPAGLERGGKWSRENDDGTVTWMGYDGALDHALLTVPAWEATRFTSSAQTVVPAGQLNVAHGLGARPRWVSLELETTAFTNAFPVGRRLLWHGEKSLQGVGTGYGYQLWWDETNILIRFGDKPNPIIVNNAATGQTATGDPASFDLYVTAGL